VSLLCPADCQNRSRLELGGTLARPEVEDPEQLDPHRRWCTANRHAELPDRSRAP
jgi:hypothetical protein